MNATLAPTLTDRATDILTFTSGTFMAVVSMAAVSVAMVTLF